MDNWQDHITSDPNVCHGRACIRGTRVMVSVVLDNLAAGRSPAEIATDYLMVTLEGVRATLAYAADLPPSLVRVASLDVELHA
jgi:uncharacterized protein (DUF433 family)